MKEKLYFVLIILVFAISAVSAAAQSASVLGTQREDIIFAGDGTDELVKCFSKNAIVRLTENPAAEEKINAALSEIEDELMRSCRGHISEQETLLKDNASESEFQRPMFTLEMRSEMTPQRTTSGIVSFEIVDYMYSGGAHGMYEITGKTFDTRTGEELTLASLSAEPEAFRDACVTEMVRQGLVMENLWFTTADELRPAMEAIADRESWYLTDAGIVFHSSPYELAPYSEGALEFLVPYSQLPALKY